MKAGHHSTKPLRPSKPWQSQLKDIRPKLKSTLVTLEKIVDSYFWLHHESYM